MNARCTASLIAGLALILAAFAARAAVTEAEYFLGADPGEGNGTALAVTPVTDSTASDLSQSSIPNNLPPGTHQISLRVKDSAGRWSAPLIRRFTIYPADYRTPDPSLTATTNKITAAEYFVGSDPGPGRGSPVIITEEGFSAGTETLSPLPADASAGTFEIAMRFRDDSGRWGNPLIRRTTILPTNVVTATIANLPPEGTPRERASTQSYRVSLAGQFHCGGVFSVEIGGQALEVPARPFETGGAFFDRLALAINSDPVLGSLVQAQAAGGNSLLLATREVGLRSQDWVQVSSNLRVSLLQAGSLGEEGRKIIAAEYFVGLTPPPGGGAPIALKAAGSFATGFTDATFSTTARRGGPHTVGVRFKNAAGHWGNPIIRGFTSYTLFGEPDRSAPALTLLGSEVLEIPYGTEFVEPGFTASDNIDGDVTARVIVRGTVVTSIPGQYRLEYWVDDLAGNRTHRSRTVLVTDEEDPVFLGGASILHTTPPATIDLFAGLRAVDSQFGDLSYRIRLLSSNVNWFSAGTYSATYEVKDPAGNTSQLTRNITLTEDATFYPGYRTWIAGRAAHLGFSGDQLEPWADIDGDGQNNEQEWLADTDPFNKWSVLSMEYYPTSTHERMRWLATQRIAYNMEVSQDLRGWDTYGGVVTSTEACLLEYELPRDTGRSRLFYRLRAIPKQPILELP